jgi:hypothetical protein
MTARAGKKPGGQPRAPPLPVVAAPFKRSQSLLQSIGTNNQHPQGQPSGSQALVPVAEEPGSPGYEVIWRHNYAPDLATKPLLGALPLSCTAEDVEHKCKFWRQMPLAPGKNMPCCT